MLDDETLEGNEASVKLVIDNPKVFTAKDWDAARAIGQLCQEVRALRFRLKTIAEYEVTNPKNTDAANMVLIAKAALQPNN